MHRVETRVAVLACVLMALATPLRAQERSLDIQSLTAELVVLRNGEVTVRERYVVRFNGSWNGLYRSIPVEYHTAQGLNYTLRLDIESATDDTGTPLRHEVERAGSSRRIKMWVPGAHDATRTIVLTYRAHNALRFFEEHDELYWNVTGEEWDFPIQRVSARVILPEEVSGVRTASFAGAAGSTEPGTVEQTGNSALFSVARPMGFREGLTIVVGWNRGVVTRPSAAQKTAGLLAANAILLLPFVVLLIMQWLWRKHGRDPDPGSVYVRYEPPPSLTPAEAGTLLDDRPDLRDITATIVDLAVRGFIVVDETKQDQLFGLLSSRDYQLTLLRPEAWPTLKPHERALLQALSVHSDQERVLVSELQNQFYKHLPQIRKHLSGALVESGFYVSRPDVVRAVWFVVAGLAAAGTVALGVALESRYGIALLPFAIAAALNALVIAIFGWLMPRRTLEGARTHAWLLGFSEFLGRVEKDRLDRMAQTPETFEKYLPYAMALGVERNWARAFEGLATEPPSWYHSRNGGPFRPNLFVADLGRMTSAAGSAMTSQPRSSGSSGSSGFSGGSSGGGFGGGGGGGF